MATPHVAGVAALLATMDPTLSCRRIKALLIDNVDQSVRVDRPRRLRRPAECVQGRERGRVAPNNNAADVSHHEPDRGRDVQGAGDDRARGGGQRQRRHDSAGRVLREWRADRRRHDESVRRDLDRRSGGQLHADGRRDRRSVRHDDVRAGPHHRACQTSPPTVSLTSPTEGATFTSPAVDHDRGDGRATATARSTQVAFFANGAPIGTDATASVQRHAGAAPMGSYALTAIATDNQGATTTSAPVHITVQSDSRPHQRRARDQRRRRRPRRPRTRPNYPPSGAINGDRKGLQLGRGRRLERRHAERVAGLARGRLQRPQADRRSRTSSRCRTTTPRRSSRRRR